MPKNRMIAALMGYCRSSAAVRAFWMSAKNKASHCHRFADFYDGRFHFQGKLMTTISAKRINARLERVKLRQANLMRSRPFAFFTL